MIEPFTTPMSKEECLAIWACTWLLSMGVAFGAGVCWQEAMQKREQRKDIQR